MVLLLTVALQALSLTSLAGEWTGSSICTGARAACNNESVVYDMRARDSEIMHVAAYKIVDGKRVLMGESDYTYDAEHRTLTSNVTNGSLHIVWVLTIAGDTAIAGTLTLMPERTLVRNLTLTKGK
jgi:hypothetical protein